MSNVAIRLQCLYNKNINARKAYRQQQQQQQQPNYQTGHSQSHENSLCQRYLAASNNCVLFTLIYSEACLLLVIILAPYHFHRCGNRARYCLTTHTLAIMHNLFDSLSFPLFVTLLGILHKQLQWNKCFLPIFKCFHHL